MSFKFVFIASRDVRNLAAAWLFPVGEPSRSRFFSILFFTSKENNHGHDLA